MISDEVLYFEEYREEENTRAVLDLVRRKAEELGIRSIVIASTRGKVAELALEYLDPSKYNLVVVTHSSWFRPGLKQEFSEEVRRKLIVKGVKVVTAALAFGGIDKAVVAKYGFSPGQLIADVLRLFCEGVKVAVEIVLMATDAGYLEPGEKVISVAGTVKGADTALVVKAAPSRRMFELRILRILAKPLYSRPG